MDLSSQRSPDEDRAMQRQLYRAGDPQAVPKAPAPPASALANPIPVPAGVAAQGVGATGGKAASDRSSRGKRLLLMLLSLGVGRAGGWGDGRQSGQ
jgi:hypothetical protein